MEKDMNKGSRKYLAALIVLFIGLMLISGCTAYTEILPNLCHSDKDGMIICDCPPENRTYHGHCIEEELKEKIKTIICNDDKSICIDADNPTLGDERVA